MDKDAKAELVSAIRQRYGQARKKDKSRILDEFVAITGHHRKYALRLLMRTDDGSTTTKISGRRIYGEAVSGALVTLWEASDGLCGKRLKAILPKLLESLEAHGHLELDQDIRQRLLTVSAATIDRLLRPYRTQVTGKRTRRPKRPTRSKVNIKTFSEWVDVAPGNLEIDFVAHCGGNLSGSFIHSFVATDVASGWTESVPLLSIRINHRRHPNRIRTAVSVIVFYERRVSRVNFSVGLLVFLDHLTKIVEIVLDIRLHIGSNNRIVTGHILKSHSVVVRMFDAACRTIGICPQRRDFISHPPASLIVAVFVRVSVGIGHPSVSTDSLVGEVLTRVFVTV